MTTLDGAFCLAESNPPFIAQMWTAIREAEPSEDVPSPWSMRRVVATLYEGILHLKALGRKPAQICEFLTQHSGLSITPSTLATYLSREKTQRKSEQRHSRKQTQTQASPVMQGLDVHEAVALNSFVEPSHELGSEASMLETVIESASSYVEQVSDVREEQVTEPEKAEMEAVEPPFSPSFEATASPSESNPTHATLPYWKRVRQLTRAQTDRPTKTTEQEKEKLKPAPEPLLDEPEFNHIARLQLPPDD